MASKTGWRRRLVRGLLALIVLIVAGASVAWFSASPASRRSALAAASRLPLPEARLVKIAILKAMQAGQGVAYVVAPLGVAILAWRVIRGRRSGERRPRSARLLLACGSGLFALVMLEVAAAGWQSWSHRVAVGPTIRPGKVGIPSDAIYIVVLGESSAAGFPYSDWLSIGHILEWQLQKVFPGRRVRVDILAEEGATLEAALRKFTDLPRKPDAVLVYSGHNEVPSRIPLDRAVPHYLDELTPLDRISLGMRRYSPLAALIQEGLDGQKTVIPPAPELRHLVDVPALTPAESSRLLRDFRARLEALAAYCERAGILPILLIPPGNDSGFDPNRSVLAASTPKLEREALAGEFTEARAREATEPSKSLAAYRSFLERHPEFAEAHFRLAVLLERSGDSAGANRHYALARDLDGLPIRCTTPYEDAYREVAGRHPCVLIDGPAVLRRLTPRGIIGDGVLHDAQHPNLLSYVALSQDILGRLQARGAFGWPRESPAPRLDPSEVAAHFRMSTKKWADVCMFSCLFDCGTLSLRFENARRLEMANRYEKAANLIAMKTPLDKVGIPGLGAPPLARPPAP